MSDVKEKMKWLSGAFDKKADGKFGDVCVNVKMMGAISFSHHSVVDQAMTNPNRLLVLLEVVVVVVVVVD